MKLPTIIALLWLVCLPSCKSIQKSSASQTEVRTTHNSELITHKSYIINHTSTINHQKTDHIIIAEIQTITEYDTSKPGNPIAKVTKTEKNTRKGTQTSSNKQQSQGQQCESQSINSETHNSELITQNSELHTSVPVIQTTARWYVVGGIIIAAITLLTAIIARRRRKQRARSSRL